RSFWGEVINPHPRPLPRSQLQRTGEGSFFRVSHVTIDGSGDNDSDGRGSDCMEIAPGVFDLTPPQRGYLKGGFVHAYLIVHGSELLLVDTLFDPDGQVILDQIRALGKQVSDLKHILITHAHRAHLGGLKKLKELSGATVYAHAWEADIVAGDRQQQGVNL